MKGCPDDNPDCNHCWEYEVCMPKRDETASGILAQILILQIKTMPCKSKLAIFTTHNNSTILNNRGTTKSVPGKW